MARVLCAWELGGQLGHLANLAILARIADALGHEVAVALRELQAARAALGAVPRRWYQAPASHAAPPPPATEIACYADMLLTSGYADPGELRALVDAWRSVLDAYEPDVLVCDHSPTALLASRERGLRRVVVGSGFLVPPPESPLGVFPDASRSRPDLARMRASEARVLRNIEQAVTGAAGPGLDSLGALYDEADLELLLTFPELDPFARGRVQPVYHGVWTEGTTRDSAGRTEAAAGPADRFVFAYLTAFPAHRALLGGLRDLAMPVLVYSRDIDRVTRQAFESPQLRFVDGLLDLPGLAGRCALFVSHGAHSSVAQTLLAAVPQLMIPNYKEQLFTALRVRALGAGRIEANDRPSYAATLRRVLDEPGYGDAAHAFAARHAQYDPDAARRQVASRLRRLLEGSAAPAVDDASARG